MGNSYSPEEHRSLSHGRFAYDHIVLSIIQGRSRFPWIDNEMKVRTTTPVCHKSPNAPPTNHLMKRWVIL